MLSRREEEEDDVDDDGHRASGRLGGGQESRLEIIPGAPDRSQHGELLHGAHSSLHHGDQPDRFSDRSSRRLRGSVVQLFRDRIESKESGGRERGGRRKHLLGQQHRSFPLQTDQRSTQQHAHQSTDRHVSLQSLLGDC